MESTDAKLDALTALVETGFGAVAADIGSIREQMATKDDLKNFATKADLATFATKDDVRVIVREELRDVRSDVKAIRAELEELREKVDNITGYRKEIDHALERIAAVEKHLGMSKKIAA